MDTGELKASTGVTMDAVQVGINTSAEEQPSPSSKSSTADEVSSIEALNWSDFEEDDDPISRTDLGLLQSIHSVLSDEDSQSGSVMETAVKMSTSESSQDTTTTNEDTQNHQLESDHLMPVGDNETTSATAIRQGVKRKREPTPRASTLTVPSINNEPSGDLSSNAAVLDDGPIWAKGSKRYKFEENRRVNRKLTFGVLLSVVLAVGLGLGNLVAYNEYEAELSNKATEVPCTASKEVIPTDATPPLPATLPTASEDKHTDPSTVPVSTLSQLPSPVTSLPETPPPPLKTSRPMIDPEYASHAAELSRVIRKLDELSRKFDRIENTTRHLSGIVMMQGDAQVKETEPAPNPHLRQQLADLLQAKKEKGTEVNEDEESNVKTPKTKSQQVIEAIADVILEALRKNGYSSLDEYESRQQHIDSTDTNTLHLDDKDDESLQTPPVQSLPTLSPSPDFVLESAPAFDKIQDEPRTNENSQNAEVEQSINEQSNTRLKRDTSGDLILEDFEGREFQSFSNIVAEWKKANAEGVLKEAERQKEIQRKFDFELEKLRKYEEYQKQKHAEYEKKKQSQAEENEKQKQKKHEEKEKQKQKKHEEKEKQKQKKRDEKRNRKDKEAADDWETLRAQHREASRHASEDKFEKHKNVWQTERSRLREQLRTKI